MKFQEAQRHMRNGARFRRPKWKRGAYVYAQKNVNAKTERVTWLNMMVAHEEEIKKDGQAVTLLRPATPWVASPADFTADDWAEQTEEDAASCVVMNPDQP